MNDNVNDNENELKGRQDISGDMFDKTGLSELKGFQVDKETEIVAYNDEKHIYIGKSGNYKGKKFTSVTTLLGKYHEHFDSELMSRYKALEKILGVDLFAKKYKMKILKSKQFDYKYVDNEMIDREEFECVVNEFKDAWTYENKIACEHGTKIHAIQENSFYAKPEHDLSKYKIPGTFKTKQHCYDLESCENGIFPEFFVTYASKDGFLRIAGQVDLLIKRGNDIYILDYKTNKKLDFESYSFYSKEAKKKLHRMMLAPIDHIQDCNFMHYTLQLSIYAFLVQQMNPKYKIKQLKIIYFPHEGGELEYELDYLKKEAYTLLKHHKSVTKKEEEFGVERKFDTSPHKSNILNSNITNTDYTKEVLQTTSGITYSFADSDNFITFTSGNNENDSEPIVLIEDKYDYSRMKKEYDEYLNSRQPYNPLSDGT